MEVLGSLERGGNLHWRKRSDQAAYRKAAGGTWMEPCSENQVRGLISGSRCYMEVEEEEN